MDTKLLLGVWLLLGHYFADYSHLSTNEMLSAKKYGTPLLPIFEHAFFHSSFVIIGCSIYGCSNSVLLLSFLFELSTHFIIDTLKGKCNKWFPVVESASNREHWYVFGFDQFLHHLVLLIIFYSIIK